MAVSMVATVSCGSGGDTIRTSPPGPPLHGRVVVFSEANHAVLAVSAVDGTPTTTTIVAGATAASVSPDGGTLAYVADPPHLVLRDLATGTEQRPELRAGDTVLTPAPGCLSWSPDSRNLDTFVRENAGLYVTTLDGTATTIDEPKTALYVTLQDGSLLLARDPAAGGTPVRSQLSCGRWLDAGRLAFDRVGEMPAHLVPVDGKAPGPLPVDTTTVAVLEGARGLVDSAQRWTIRDACGDHVIAEGSGKLYVADTDRLTGNGPEDPASAARELNPGAAAVFVPGSCDVLAVGQGAGVFHPARRIDPTGGAAHDLPPVFDDSERPPTFAVGTFAWAPAPEPTVVAVRGTDGVTVFLHDLDTGGRTRLRLPDGTGLSGVLGWVA